MQKKHWLGQAVRYIFFLPYMAAKKRMSLPSLTQKALQNINFEALFLVLILMY